MGKLPYTQIRPDGVTEGEWAWNVTDGWYRIDSPEETHPATAKTDPLQAASDAVHRCRAGEDVPSAYRLPDAIADAYSLEAVRAWLASVRMDAATLEFFAGHIPSGTVRLWAEAVSAVEQAD